MVDPSSPQIKLLKAIAERRLADIRDAIELGASLDYHYTNEEIRTQYCSEKAGDMTPFYMAIIWAMPQVADYLLLQGANPAERCQDNTVSPVHQALKYDTMADLLRIMLQQPATHTLQLKNGNYPLDTAIATQSIVGLQTLLEAGVSPNVFNQKNVPPLWALSLSTYSSMDLPVRKQMANIMLAAGADMRLTHDGVSILDYNRGNLAAYYWQHQEALRDELKKTSSPLKTSDYVQDGKPTSTLLKTCGAGLLPHLFLPQHWQGKEAEAVEFCNALGEHLPPYFKPEFAYVDMSRLHSEAVDRNETESAITRYVRPSAHAYGRRD